MANYIILSSCVQGIPSTLTLTGSTVPSLASLISARQVGMYFYAGETAADTDLGDATAIARLTTLGAIVAQ